MLVSYRNQLVGFLYESFDWLLYGAVFCWGAFCWGAIVKLKYNIGILASVIAFY